MSIFDKAYRLLIVDHAFSQFHVSDLSFWEKMSMPKFMDFELEAHKLLKDGGTKNKPFKVINDI